MIIKLYPNLLEATILALKQIFLEDKKADRTIEGLFSQEKKWGSRDRRFVASLIYESVRWHRKILYCSQLESNPATHEEWQTYLICSLAIQGFEFTIPTGFPQLNTDHLKNKSKEIEERAVLESIPSWLDDYAEKQLGENLWKPTLHSLNQYAPVVLRVNTLKTTVQKLSQQLSRIGVETETVGPFSLKLQEDYRSLKKTQMYADGCFELQDYSSQQVVPFLNPRPGSVVVDACAGAGGKSLHLAAHMQNKGFIKALDIHEIKLQELKKRAERASASIISTLKVGQEGNLPHSLTSYADYLLLDVPCSGLGVLKRNPDTKWKLSPHQLEEIIALQRTLLEKYTKILKPGAEMVYATCSILPIENQQQIAGFLESSSGRDFHFIEEKIILPQDFGYDGFYMAKLKKIR
jgi:16S rRNA (cytosine967-C5)-methyltransferase